MKTLIYSIALASLALTGVNAQQVTSHTPWTKDDSAAINALALYPDSVRMEIFTACEYPAIIVNVASLQKNSSTAFADLVSSYSKTKQEDVWNLSRYPNLISRLVDGGKKSKEDIETILKDYPAEIHDVALKYGRDEYDLLKKVDDLQINTNQQFNDVISSYPPDVQKTFTDLLQLPEVMSLLNDHLSLSVRVGDKYKRDPQWVMRKSDSNAAAQAKINAEQLQDWKQTMQQDTGAQTEMKAAANEYATDNGYNQSDVDAPLDDADVNNYAVYPYSYWFGYPTWYPYSYWYPYPYWYDWGFYYGPGGNMIVFGFPSFYFTNWYFCYPHHWNRYPHLGSAYIHHYYGPHRLNTMSRQVVHNWVHANRSYLPADFIRNDATRVNAMKQYGQLNEKVANRDGTINTKARDEYFSKNSAKYDALNSHPEQAKIPDEKQGVDVRQPFTRQPAVVPQRSQSQTIQSQRVQPQRTQPSAQPRYNYNNIQRAQSYHSGGWQQAQPTYHSAPQQSAPARSFGGGGGGAVHSSGGGGRR
jgi:hypothetical protein